MPSSIAHEIAHFLVDYWLPRQRALVRLGESIREVLDGLRPPTVEERVHALIVRTPLGLHVEWMEREARADDLSGALWDVEAHADRVALALLAPPAEVFNAVNDVSALSYQQRDQRMIQTLVRQFGLPQPLAVPYARSLLNASGLGRSWLEMIGLR